MSQKAGQFAQSSNFNLAFQQMANFVAISKTRNQEDTLRELIIQCFVITDGKQLLFNKSQLVAVIEKHFGLKIVLEFYVDQQLEKLKRDNIIKQNPDLSLTLSPEIQEALKTAINQAIDLEKEVKDIWLEEIKVKYPILSLDNLWPALQAYLAKAFRRHGIQAISLLDTSITDSFSDPKQNLTFLLNESVRAFFASQHQNDAKTAIISFLANVGNYPQRATYITQLADGAFNYFSLTVDPEVAANFRKNLKGLILILDTNFLLGILDLSNNPQVEVSNELLKAVKQHNLPFRLRYIDKTKEELSNTIQYYGSKLSDIPYNLDFSKSIAASPPPSLSGIEIAFHQMRATHPGMDVETFLSPYNDITFLLEDRNIRIYNSTPPYNYANRLTERVNLNIEYEEFLKNTLLPYTLIRR